MNLSTNKIFEKFSAYIKKSKKILITTHIFPDADGIGSQIALNMALKTLDKSVVCCNEEKLLSRYNYLDPERLVQSHSHITKKLKFVPDLIIVVDTNTLERSGKKMMKLSKDSGAKVIYIDHHPFENYNPHCHLINTKAAATGQLVGELILKMKIKLTPQMALPLYTAILIDTSSFRYPTVSSKTHLLISKLMATGIKPPVAYNQIYGTKRIEHMHLLGKVLSTVRTNFAGDIAWMKLDSEDLEKFGIDFEDTHAFINHLLILDDVKVACMFRKEKNEIKLSLRSSSEVDVGAIAIALGGGGHSHSAATLIEVEENDDRSFTQVIKPIIKKIENLLS